MTLRFNSVTSDISPIGMAALRGRMANLVRFRRLRMSTVAGIGTVALVGFFFAFPIVWAALSSLTATPDILQHRYPLSWMSVIPLRPTLENYALLFGQVNFQRNLLNTMIAGAGQVTLAVITSTMAGYAFARLRFPGRDLMFPLLMVTAFIQAEAIIVPLYKVVQSMGLASTYAAIFLPLRLPALRHLPDAAELPGHPDRARGGGADRRRRARAHLSPHRTAQRAPGHRDAGADPVHLVVERLSVAARDHAGSRQADRPGRHRGSQELPQLPHGRAALRRSHDCDAPLVFLSIALQRYYVRGLVTSGMR